MAESEATDTPVPRAARLLSVHEAIAILDAEPVSARVTSLTLMDARGYRLADPIRADRDAPAFDKSLMDGFAVRVADVRQTPARLRVIGEIKAGAAPRWGVVEGQAIAIMTGAPLPPGADAVVPVEQARRDGEDVIIEGPVRLGNAIARKGTDCVGGEPVLERGALMGAAQIAVAASVGAARVRVFERPRVAVLTTGDEVIAFDAAPDGAKIRNSNSPMLVALLTRLGCDVTDLGHAPDDPAMISAAAVKGFAFDALFITGGMSMGEYDYVPKILQDLGVELKITKLSIKPGKPFVFGRKGAANVFGLPGNPVSAFICTLRLASRILKRLSGAPLQDKWVAGKLAAGLSTNGPREFYQPVIWAPAAGSKSATNEFAAITPLTWKGSADVYTLSRANALLVRSENEPPVPKGTLVRVLEIPI